MADPFVPGALNLSAAQLAANQLMRIDTTGPRIAQSTLGNLAQFFDSQSLGNIVSTSITTVGDGLLTAAALNGGLIVRSGSVAAYTDTTATAAQLLTALGADAPVGTSWLVYIKNLTAFSETLAAGSGVTLSGNKDVIPPNSMGIYLMTYATNAPTFTMQGLAVVSLTNALAVASTTLSTVGAGTITAAGIALGFTNRTGTQSAAAFTDTTPTAAQIIAAIPNARVGLSFFWTYRNNTDGTITLAGGDGNVTISGTTIVPKNTWVKYLVTYSATGTITIAAVESGSTVPLPPSKTVSGSAATFAAGDITGAYVTNYTNTGNNATLTTRTAAQMFGDIPNCQIGVCYQLLIRNTNATTATITAADGSVTLTGTMTIAQNVTRTFSVVFTSATAVTITSMGISAAGA